MNNYRLHSERDGFENSCCNQVFVNLLSVKIRGTKSAIFSHTLWVDKTKFCEWYCYKSSQAAIQVIKSRDLKEN